MKRAELLAALRALERPHQACDDDFYSCPALAKRWAWTSTEKGGEFLAELPNPGPCECGADEHNARLAELVRRLELEDLER